MPTYVLVHGGTMSTETWNRLSGRNRYPPGGHLGAGYWDGTAAYLAEHGHRVFTPALGDERSSSLSDHIAQVCGVITGNGLADVILVGHSYGGFVITGVADRLPGKIRHLVYLDSGLPDPGESLMDLLGMVNAGRVRGSGGSRGSDRRSGGKICDSSGGPAHLPDPAPPYVEKIRYNPATIRRLKKTYIRCTKSEFVSLTRRSWKKAGAVEGGWTRMELPSSHVPMADIPQRFYRLMLSFASR
jgi:pimeloyl-ACP methyl ester carboxylesterase